LGHFSTTEKIKMDKKMVRCLKDLANVLEKHKAGLTYTTRDDGVHVVLGGDWVRKVCIGFVDNGDVSGIRKLAGLEESK
jgi:hypothetical protein